MIWTDSHCHIQDPDAFPDPEATLVQARAAGVETVVVIGTDPEDWHRALAFCDRHPRVRCALGWHPNMTHAYTPESMNELERLVQHPAVVAIGETGLDEYWQNVPLERQELALHAHLDLADRTGLPLVFHVRNPKEPAEGPDTYQRLATRLRLSQPKSFVVHCFAGQAHDAEAFLELGGYLGINGPVTYKKNDGFRDVVADLPRDRVVLETDSPYLSPMPFRGKPNQPAYIPYIGAQLAELWGLPVEEVANITTSNVARLFGI